MFSCVSCCVFFWDQTEVSCPGMYCTEGIFQLVHKRESGGSQAPSLALGRGGSKGSSGVEEKAE